MQLRVLSWNIWYDGFLKKWVDFLQSNKADIIGLQEVRINDKKYDIIEKLEALGYKHFFAETEQVWEGEKYQHGPAIFTTLPILHAEKIQLAPVGDNERAAAYTQVDVEGMPLHVFNTHLVHTHQKESREQKAQVDILVNRFPVSRVIAMGDFNATPESAAVQKMSKVLVDSDPLRQPTWSVYPEGCGKCKPQNIDTKLDYIFVSKDLKTNSFEVGLSSGSDHLPILVNVEVPKISVR
jgi:endonuclease/exonuclease/phosphatase family metal-dependent hydrolase